MPAPLTTVRDVTLDVVAALDMYEGLMGGEDTSIERVGPGERDESVVLVLSNGDEYRLRVDLIREGQQS